jgi:hypothetical protein
MLAAEMFKKGKETEMNRRLGRLLFALNAGVVGGGVTSSLADEAGIKARIGELRGAVLSLLEPTREHRRNMLRAKTANSRA